MKTEEFVEILSDLITEINNYFDNTELFIEAELFNKHNLFLRFAEEDGMLHGKILLHSYEPLVYESVAENDINELISQLENGIKTQISRFVMANLGDLSRFINQCSINCE